MLGVLANLKELARSCQYVSACAFVMVTLICVSLCEYLDLEKNCNVTLFHCV